MAIIRRSLLLIQNPRPSLSWGVSTASISLFSTSTKAMASDKPKKGYSIVSVPTDFEEQIANRAEFDHKQPHVVTKSPDSKWEYGKGSQTHSAASPEGRPKHKEIDPYGPDRSIYQNYKLLVSGIAPRPIGFLSTMSADGKTKNLAPFSYFQLVEHNPPQFVVSFSSRRGPMKDTYRNLKETGECVINTVSEHMIEAVSASSIDAPYGVSEWEITGLHEAPTTTVKPSRVEESVFSIEGKVVDIKEFDTPEGEGMSQPGLALIKATRFWVREDAANKDFSHIDIDKLKPIAQLGGMSYGLIRHTFELPRTSWKNEQPRSEFLTQLEKEYLSE